MSAVSVSIGILPEDPPERAQSVIWVQSAAPIDNIRAFWLQGSSMADTGWTPEQLSTGQWRVYSTRPLRTVRDVIVGWTAVEGDGKIQWYQWDGWTHRFDWTEQASNFGDELYLANIALEQIKQARLDGRGPDRLSPPSPRFGFGIPQDGGR